MNDKRRLQDMLAAIGTIEGFGLTDFETFKVDKKTQDAVMYNLIIMGEAANQVPPDVQERHSSIPWSAIIGTRNVIVHGYDQVKLQVVWGIIKDDLAKLKLEIQKAIEKL